MMSPVLKLRISLVSTVGLFLPGRGVWAKDTSPRPPVAAVASKQFAGEVQKVEPGKHQFVMRAGSSKRQGPVTIILDAKTRWSGLPRQQKLPRVGDRVFVVVTPKGSVYVAGSILVMDPNSRPKIGPGTQRSGTRAIASGPNTADQEPTRTIDSQACRSCG